MFNRNLVKVIGIFFVLMVLLSTIGGAIPLKAAGSGNSPDSKVSSLLALRVKLKTQDSAQANNKPQGNLTLPGGDIQAAGDLTQINTEKVFLYFTQQPTDTQLKELTAQGVTAYPDSWMPPVGSFKTGFILADMPVDKLGALDAKSYITQIDTAEETSFPQNDAARTAMDVGSVWTGGNTGTGVTVAVLDSGIDTSNPDFPVLNSTNSKDYWNYPTLDDTITTTVTGHGTHVTGSVLGRGVNSPTYKGVAPDANLVFLKIGNDSTGSATSNAMVYALRASVDTYHARIITMSYGGWSTYHDGSDAICQAVDYAISQGVTVFISAGNNGSSGWHISGTVAANSTSAEIPITVATGSTSYLYMDMVWYDGIGTHNSLNLLYYNSSHTPLTSDTSGRSESSRGTESDLFQLSSMASSGTYYLRVQNTSSNTQFYHIYYMGGSGAVTFSSADPNYTLGNPAEADGAIAVGAYVTRQSWTNYQGLTYNYGETLGSIASFSSRGPRVDGSASNKPEIVAPGSSIISVRDSIYVSGTANDPLIIDNDGLNLNGSGPANYLVMEGTSMACPLAAGVGALMLSANPSLTPAQVKSILEITATDKGPAGFDPAYGFGFINAAAAVDQAILFRKPVLSNGSVTPKTGDTSTSFVFAVTYASSLNLPPSWITVSIDGGAP